MRSESKSEGDKNPRKTHKLDVKDLDEIDIEIEEEEGIGMENHKNEAEHHESNRRKALDFVDEDPENLKLTKVARGNRKTHNHNSSFSQIVLTEERDHPIHTLSYNVE